MVSSKLELKTVSLTGVVQRTVDDKIIVTGVDPELLEKALKELIPHKEDDPVGMKVGLCFYGYRGHWIVCDTTTGQLHWSIQTIDRSKLPQRMEGKFTSQVLARTAVDKFADPKAIEEGEAILERKQKKLNLDKANGTKTYLPDEQEKLQVRAFEETQKLVRRDAAKDKATIME